jgi:hypothetical protein
VATLLTTTPNVMIVAMGSRCDHSVDYYAQCDSGRDGFKVWSRC